MKTNKVGSERIALPHPRQNVRVLATLIAAVALVVGSAVQVSVGADRRPRTENKAFMRIKMAWSDGVLEGLTLEKFDQVSRYAIRLRDMTHSNNWYTYRQPDYMRQTTNFQASADAIYMAAVDKNLDAATDAYVKMMRNCIECHRLVRVEQRRNAPPTAPAKGEGEVHRERGQP